MTDTATELNLVVGSMITMRPDEDMEAFEEERDMLSQVQDLLREEGIVVDLLALPGTEVWEGGIEWMGSLYQLSRLATRLENEAAIAPVLEDGPVIYESEMDPFVTDVWDELKPTRFPHLVNLQGINSYYLPIAFATPIWLPFEEDGEVDEAFFGSSIALHKELAEVETLLQQADVPPQAQAYQCLRALHEGATQSIQHNLPLTVW